MRGGLIGIQSSLITFQSNFLLLHVLDLFGFIVWGKTDWCLEFCYSAVNTFVHCYTSIQHVSENKQYYSFIHSGYFYGASWSPLLLRGAPDIVSEFHAEAPLFYYYCCCYCHYSCYHYCYHCCCYHCCYYYCHYWYLIITIIVVIIIVVIIISHLSETLPPPPLSRLGTGTVRVQNVVELHEEVYALNILLEGSCVVMDDTLAQRAVRSEFYSHHPLRLTSPSIR